MKRSVLLRRVLLAATVSTLCVILFTIMIFSLVYQIRFVRSEGDDLLAKVRVLGNLVTHWGEKATLEEAVATAKSILRAERTRVEKYALDLIRKFEEEE